MRLNGRGISPGLALGAAFVYEDILLQPLDEREVDEADLENEVARIERCIETALEELTTTVSEVTDKLDAEHAAIFKFQAAILHDRELREDLRREILYARRNAEQAVLGVFRRWEKRFRSMGDPLLRQRSEDLRDVSRRVLGKLRGAGGHSLDNVPENSVIVAKRLLPSDTVVLSRKQTAAVAVERGGPASHAAIIAREMGIPAVAGLTGLLDEVADGDDILVDGFRGLVEIQPTAEARREFEKRATSSRMHLAAAQERKGEPAVTTDGVTITVLANVGNREDAQMAVQNGAEGIGLYRTEQPYLASRGMPDPDALLASFSGTLKAFQGKPVTVRLIDIGGDKEVPYIDTSLNERNPFLGRRGVRLLLESTRLLDEQLEVLLRLAGDHQMRILIPMVTFASEVKEVRRRLEARARALSVRAVPPLGAMIETPAAALCVAEIAAECEFLSVGTNDLTQYTLAASREDANVVEYFKDDHASVLRLLQIIVDEAGNLPVSICGELAGNVDAVALLIRMGFRILSVAPPLIPSVKEAIRRSHVQHAENK